MSYVEFSELGFQELEEAGNPHSLRTPEPAVRSKTNNREQLKLGVKNFGGGAQGHGSIRQ